MFIKRMQEVFVVDCPEGSVLNLMETFADQVGLSPRDMLLLCDGKQFAEDASTAEIPNEATIHVINKWRGGML